MICDFVMCREDHLPTIPGLVGRVGGNCAEGFSCRNTYLFRTTGHSFSPQSLFFMSFSCNRAGSHKKCCRPASSNIISMKTKTRSKHLNAHIHHDVLYSQIGDIDLCLHLQRVCFRRAFFTWICWCKSVLSVVSCV